jgi:hypothetical protein
VSVSLSKLPTLPLNGLMLLRFICSAVTMSLLPVVVMTGAGGIDHVIEARDLIALKHRPVRTNRVAVCDDQTSALPGA